MNGEILIKLSPKHKPELVTPKVHTTGKYGYVMIGGVQLGARTDAMIDLLQRLIRELRPTIPHHQFDRVLTITPAEVIQYFEQSPYLREMAGDVAQVLRPEPMAIDQLDQDIQTCAHLDNPSLADISELLTGDRQYGGAIYKRVKAVKQALENTTTPANGKYSQNTTKQAA